MTDESRRSPISDPERLERLASLDLLDTPPEAAFDNISTLVGRLLDTPVALVSFVDEQRQFFKSCYGTIAEPWMSERQTPLSHSFCRIVVERSQPLVVEDAREHPLVRENRAIEELGVIAYAGMPITTSDGLILGSLCAVDTRPRRWTEQELSSLALAAESLNTEIDLRTRLRDESALRAELESAKAVAERANAAKDRLLAHVSHELRTPLSGVLGFAELLDDERLDSEQRSFLDTVRRSADSLLHVVDGLLRYVDLRSTLGPVAHTPFRPVELVAELRPGVGAEGSDGGVPLTVEIDDEMPAELVGDPGRIRAVLGELVSNSLRFTDRGEVVVRASTSTDPGGQLRLHVQVRDTGIGIGADRLADIFEPLTGHDGSGGHARGGVGMGLALARLHAEALAGEITVESAPEEGSAFTFSLPVAVA